MLGMLWCSGYLRSLVQSDLCPSALCCVRMQKHKLSSNAKRESWRHVVGCQAVLTCLKPVRRPSKGHSQTPVLLLYSPPPHFRYLLPPSSPHHTPHRPSSLHIIRQKMLRPTDNQHLHDMLSLVSLCLEL